MIVCFLLVEKAKFALIRLPIISNEEELKSYKQLF
ncbi:hypothetical protein SRABI27_03924 [Pedobacter sp. Bi27]|nr:hypothetical protein SRABI36_00008 [Pedobacter sp. Bi36]CAH0174727.1 hypothetical protein SRABI126_01106 [Pedobacter sp. Bi126]CAH0285936.1 hypothetical protein SRABI27_03924 [Pedobacter sp. Bi27]